MLSAASWRHWTSCPTWGLCRRCQLKVPPPTHYAWLGPVPLSTAFKGLDGLRVGWQWACVLGALSVVLFGAEVVAKLPQQLPCSRQGAHISKELAYKLWSVGPSCDEAQQGGGHVLVACMSRVCMCMGSDAGAFARGWIPH